MKEILGSAEGILNDSVSGFHQYILDTPIHLVYVSGSFCDMLGYGCDELLSEAADMYASLVYPADRELYSDFIHTLSEGEKTLSAEYRVLKKDGTVIYVSDTMSSKRLDDGRLVGYSTLTDITHIKNENNNLRFLNETIPCGFLRYTCEKNPKVTYVNEQMLKILRFPEIKDGELDYLELYKENIYLMIPIEERRRFSHFLNRVYAQSSPIAGEMTVLRCDGTKARLYGWVTKSITKEGGEEFQSVCMDVTERYHAKKASETERYLKALTDVYDRIFEYDFSNNTVKCLYGQTSGVFKHLENISMNMEEATQKWINGSVIEEDREMLKRFFKENYNKKETENESKPPQIRYRALSSSGEVKPYTGIFLKIDPSVSFFCCRSGAYEGENDSLRSENDSLRSMNANMQELVMRFTDGIVAFEVEDDRVRPLYASDNVCEFFGYTKEEWIKMSSTNHSIKEFVSKSGVEYEEFAELFEKGEAEFDYIDVNTRTSRRIKAVCSHMFSDGTARKYVMLYDVSDKIGQNDGETGEKGQIYIRTFGYFDVFINEKPIAFRNKKSKELFALLADRRGGYVSSEEAISFLWEDEEVNAVTLSRYRKVALRLKNILEEYGIADIVESVDGKRRVVTEKVRCDLYDYLSGRQEYAQLFKGSYLTNYSWGETTLGELLGEHIY